MSLLALLVVVGVLLYIVNAVLPMDPKIKLIFNAIVTLAVLLWLLSAFGILNAGPVIRFHA